MTSSYSENDDPPQTLKDNNTESYITKFTIKISYKDISTYLTDFTTARKIKDNKN